MKIKYIFHAVVILGLILLTYNWVSNYFFPHMKYPFENKDELLQLYTFQLVRFGNFPINTKADIKVNSESIENIFRIIYRYESFISDEIGGFANPVPLFHVDDTIELKVFFNKNELNLTITQDDDCEQKLEYPSGKIVKTDCRYVEKYKTPQIWYTPNNYQNELEIDVRLKRSISPSNNLSVPIFFSKEKYSKSTDIPTIQIVIENNKTSKPVRVEVENPYEFYKLSEKYSGWEGLFTLKDVYRGPIFSVPLEQNVVSNDDKTIFEARFSDSNNPYGFNLIFIPNIKIFIILLSFLWSPYFILSLIKLKLMKKINPTLRNQLLSAYGLIIVVFGFVLLKDLNSFLQFFEFAFNVVSKLFLLILIIFPTIVILFNNKLK